MGAVFLIDIDNLKVVNDAEGHPAGDALIRQVAEAVKTRVRPNELVIRWGGDEFLVVIDGVAADEIQGRREAITVPNVTVVSEAEGKAIPDIVVRVSKQASALTVTDATGKVIMHAPVTSGSQHDPLPIGSWTVTAVARNPVFNYNPDLFWDADPKHAKAKLPPGPNGPVGVIWIDIDKPHYGIHGTPEPGTVGHTTSHGCVRLTNWDALKLAAMVGKGTKVEFTE